MSFYVSRNDGSSFYSLDYEFVRLLDSKRNDVLLHALKKFGHRKLAFHFKELCILHANNPEVLEARDDEGYTALSYSAMVGLPEHMESLIDNGADLHVREPRYFRSPFEECIVRNLPKDQVYNELAFKMISKMDPSKLDHTDDYGCTALHWVVKMHRLPPCINETGFNNTRHLVALVLLGANVNDQDKRRRTPLIIAAERGLTDFVCLLIQANANLDTTDEEGFSAVQYAAKGNHKDAFALLLYFRARVPDNLRQAFDANDVDLAMELLANTPPNQRSTMLNLINKA